MFGHEKGAFTGAIKQNRGKIEYAEGGTLLLDEVGDLPPPLQVKLLRFLQERVIERVGGRQSMPVDVRVICATHRDLPGLIRVGQFREDFYYRISEITVRIPPLRERDEDVVLVARALLSSLGQQLGKTLLGLAPDALQALRTPMPGRVMFGSWKTGSSGRSSCANPTRSPRGIWNWSRARRPPSRSICARRGNRPSGGRSSRPWPTRRATFP